MVRVEQLYTPTKQEDQDKRPLILVTQDSDTLAMALIEGHPTGNSFPGVRAETQFRYPNGDSSLEGKAGEIHVVTLEGTETMDVLPQTLTENAYVAAVVTNGKPKAGYRTIHLPERRQMNGQLGWVTDAADTVLALNPHPGSVRKDAFYGVLAEKRKHEADLFTFKWFMDRKYNNRARQVGETKMEHFEFFMKPEREELERLNGMLERTDRPTIFIPTCPPDAYVATNGGIAYSRGALTENISWAAQNALDGLDELVPYLMSKGKNPHLVFGFGDYEYFAGYTRGMGQEEFMRATNKSAEKVAARVRAMLEETNNKPTHALTFENPKGVDTITITQDGLTRATIAGMTELSGGLDEWNKRVATGVKHVQESASDSTLQKLRARVMANREAMTLFWLRMKGLDPTPENIAAEFATDAGFYAAFHGMVKEKYGQNGLILAGDSRPMELYGSKLAKFTKPEEPYDNLLISVSGLYAGASFDK